VYPFEGEMIRLKNRHTDQLLTPNHRVIAKVRKHSRNPSPDAFEATFAEDLKQHWHVTLPMAGMLRSGSCGPSPDQAYLIGWWLTDAWAHQDGKAVVFSQCKPTSLAKLRDALAPFNSSEYVKKDKSDKHQDEYSYYVTGQLADYLLTHFPSRSLEWDVLQWSEEARFKLLEGLMDGDGSWDSLTETKRYAVCFWSQRPERRDVFLALASTLAYRAYDDPTNACVHFNLNRSTTQLQHRHRSSVRESYKGDVWCVTVPTGAFMVRRNGRVFITGNSGFPKSLDVSKAIDRAAGAERETVAPPPYSRGKATQSYSETRKVSYDYQPQPITSPATDAAIQWQGWGTALKPAHEPIVLARKPLQESTVAGNVTKHGTGAINIDGCRVELNGDYKSKANGRPSQTGLGDNYDPEKANKPDTVGRWPANVIHDGSDEVLQFFPSAPGQLAPVSGKEPSSSSAYGERQRVPFNGRVGEVSAEKRYTEEGSTNFAPLPGERRHDKGSAARFFYCAKASKNERRDSKHPTVKPIALMRYLCRLITPPGGLLLDPYAGSGTTGEAAFLEGFHSILIEMDQGYAKDIETRMDAVKEEVQKAASRTGSRSDANLDDLFE
jgi:hypothetical protein